MKKVLYVLSFLLTIGVIEASAQSSPPLSPKRIRLQGQAAPPTPNPPTGYYNIWVDSATGALNITDSAGTDTPVGAGITGLTDNVIPQANGTTAIENSKMTTSGTNSGTWTLYDDTLVTGITQLQLRDGAAQAVTPQIRFGSTGANEGVSFYVNGVGALVIMTGDRGQAKNVEYGRYNAPNSEFWISGNAGEDAFQFGSGVSLKWGDTSSYNAAKTVGLTWAASGIIKVTDGSTGSGGIGISDAATNTVSDALILRHATTDAGFGQDGFGTGLLFQAENSVGTMHDAASIDAVLTDSADTSEDSEIRFSTYAGGAEVANVLTIGNASSITTVAAPVNLRVQSNSTGYLELITPGTGPVFLGTLNAGRWQVEADGDFAPLGSNMLDIGSSSYFVKDAYLGTSIQGTRSKVLTEGAATGFVDISVASGEGTGGYVEYTVETTDGTDRTIETGMLYFSGVNLNGGTVDDSDVGLVGTPVQSTSAANVFVNTFSVTSGTDKITVNCSSATTLAGTDVITIRYRVVVNRGTATVTPIA